MPLNIQNLKIRSLSAIVYIIVFLGSIMINDWIFLAFCMLIHFGCWYEFQKLSEKINEKLKKNTSFHNIGIIVSGSAFILFLTGDFFKLPIMTMGELGWWLLLISVLILPIMDILFSKDFYVQKIYFDLLGFAYLSFSIALFLQLKTMPFNFSNDFHFPNLILLMMIASIWLNDSMAYIGGSIFGKTPFFPSISPKKTWEGTIFGLLFSVIIGAIFIYYFWNQHFILLTMIVFLSAIFGTIGDLIESKLKRLAKVKDSGNIMPGHGGFLDRFDSILFATPFIWLLVYLYQIL